MVLSKVILLAYTPHYVMKPMTFAYNVCVLESTTSFPAVNKYVGGVLCSIKRC